jgi:hypothetical protein
LRPHRRCFRCRALCRSAAAPSTRCARSSPPPEPPCRRHARPCPSRSGSTTSLSPLKSAGVMASAWSASPWASVPSLATASSSASAASVAASTFLPAALARRSPHRSWPTHRRRGLRRSGGIADPSEVYLGQQHSEHPVVGRHRTAQLLQLIRGGGFDLRTDGLDARVRRIDPRGQRVAMAVGEVLVGRQGLRRLVERCDPLVDGGQTCVRPRRRAPGAVGTGLGTGGTAAPSTSAPDTTAPANSGRRRRDVTGVWLNISAPDCRDRRTGRGDGCR